MTNRWLRSGLARALSLAVLSTSSGARSAAEDANAPAIVVERDVAAAACPNAAELLALVETARGGEAPASVRYGVHFSRAGEVFHARIEDLMRHRVRDLDDSGGSCGGLARATVVTLALLFDAELASTAAASRATETGAVSAESNDAVLSSPSAATTPDSSRTSEAQLSPPTPGVPRPVSPAAVNVPPAPAKSQAESKKQASSSVTRFGAMVGGGAIVGVATPYAFGPSVAVDVGGRLLRGELSAFWSPSQSADFGGGVVRTELTTGTLSGCVSPAQPLGLRLDICTGVTAGQLTARARGYVRDGESRRPWIALPAALSLASAEGGLGWQVQAGLLLSIQREDFRIAGLGQVYESWPVAGFIGLRLGVHTHAE